MGNDALHQCKDLYQGPLYTTRGCLCWSDTKGGKECRLPCGAWCSPLFINPYGMIISQNEGSLQVVDEKRYGEVLGIHLIGKDASEMAGQAVRAIQMEATIEELSRVPFPHPTLSEFLAEVVKDAPGKPIYLP
jgi:hypothetical protein